MGFANLPNQVHRKSVKKGFEFTLMVVGESGLGKSTLVNSLFLTDLYPERIIPDAVGKHIRKFSKEKYQKCQILQSVIKFLVKKISFYFTRNFITLHTLSTRL